MQHYPEKKKKTTPNHLPRYILVGLVMFIVGSIFGALVMNFLSPVSYTSVPVVYPTVNSYPTITPIAFADLVIAIQDIPCGTTISAEAVAVVPYLDVFLPTTSLTNVDDVIGKIARADIYREMPILSNTLTDNPDEVGRGCEMPKP